MWTYLYLWYLQNASAGSALVQRPQPVPMQNALRTASHAELLGAQNQAHTKLYEEYIGLKHDVMSKTWVDFFFIAIMRIYPFFFQQVNYLGVEGRVKGSP